MSRPRLAWLGTGLVAAGIVAMIIGALLPAALPGSGRSTGAGPGMMGGPGRMGPAWRGFGSAPGPSEPGFVAGTAASPRAVRILATPQLRFVPDTVRIEAGETVIFEVTTMGPTVHEFMVGPAADVAADRGGTPEVTDIGMMQTRALTYTFVGAGPFAFACHASDHYEAGMTGAIVVE